MPPTIHLNVPTNVVLGQYVTATVTADVDFKWSRIVGHVAGGGKKEGATHRVRATRAPVSSMRAVILDETGELGRSSAVLLSVTKP